MQVRFILLIAMSAAVTAASADTAATRARIPVEDLASIEQLGAPVLSPAGTEFALVRSVVARRHAESRTSSARRSTSAAC